MKHALNEQTVEVRKQSLWRRIWKNRALYLCLLPFMLFLFTFQYRAMYGLTLAFKDFRILQGISASPWAGMKYFQQLFKGYSFLEVLRNTLLISLQKLIFCFPVPIALALFINEIRNARIKKVFQTFSYLPYFISWIVAASLFQEILSLNGPINEVITNLGGKAIYFLADIKYFRGVLILTDIWKGCGWSSIIYLAAIAGVDQEMYDAAQIDGANKWQQIWYVTLPCIRTTILTLFIIQVGNVMFAGFEQVYNMYSPAVYSVADIIDTYVYRQGIEQTRFSYATAAGLFQNGIGFVLVIISNFITKKLSDGEEGLW